MQIPLQVTFQHMEPSPAAETLIREKLDKLHRIYERIVNCCVVVETFTLREGRQYRVRIDLKVPRNQIVASREAMTGNAQKDLAIAIRDAFEAARGQLEDYAHQQRGEVKTHENVDASA